jgi:hypothetical protein
MGMFTTDESERMFQAINGCNARHAAGWIVVQDAGTTADGRPIYSFMGVAVGELRHDNGKGFTHEMMQGEIIVRPLAAYAGDQYRGAGLSSIITSDCYDPANWEHTLLKVG